MAGALQQPTKALVNARTLASAPELVNSVLISPQKAELIKLKLQRELRRRLVQRIEAAASERSSEHLGRLPHWPARSFGYQRRAR